MGIKKCSECGKEKSYGDFYTRKEKLDKYGIDDARSYINICKDCHLKKCKKRRTKKISYTQGLYFVYFIYNHNDELIYIGKTNDVCERIKQHQNEKRFNESDVKYVDIELLSSLCDASVREIYYINKYKPILNNRDVFEGEITCTVINELPRQRIYRQTKDQFKKDVTQMIKNYSNNINHSKKYSKPVIKIDPKTKEIIQKYDTCKAAEKDNGISEGGVSRAAKSGGKSGGFYWQYLYEEDKTTDRFKN